MRSTLTRHPRRAPAPRRPSARRAPPSSRPPGRPCGATRARPPRPAGAGGRSPRQWARGYRSPRRSRPTIRVRPWPQRYAWPMEVASPRRSTVRARVLAVRPGPRERPGRLAAARPMEMRAAGPGQEPSRVAVTMRTPGNDFELAAGFLLTEGLVAPGDVEAAAYCAGVDEAQRYNVVSVRTRRAFDATLAERRFFATSSCG